MVEDLSDKLRGANFSVSSIHGSMTPLEREEKMKEFISGRTRVLVSTDLLSRGIDVQQISIVINYDIPKSVDNYLHRIGRSGRYGRKGVAINFNTPYDTPKLNAIEQHYNIKIEAFPSNAESLTEYM
jgi:superfamily II DNA/RNA helicase